MNFRRPPRRSSTASARRASSLFGAVEIVLQPILEVGSGRVVAAEALARFPGTSDSPVDETFALAYAAGRGPELEAACLRVALRARRMSMPAEVALTVNVSPDALAHPSVQSALLCDLTGVIVEITEHAAADLASLQSSIEDLRGRGAQIAIDDAGTGYAGLLRLTALRPDIVKLDKGLVTGSRDRLEQSAVIEALVSLSRRIGARVLGEGVETHDDLVALAELDVDYAQGYFLGGPVRQLERELPDATEACRVARTSLMRAAVVPEAASGPIRTATTALAATVQPADLTVALRAASADLGIDVIALSTMTPGGSLREVSCAGAEVDRTLYPLSQFPATHAALYTGELTEAHVGDPGSDRAESRLMVDDGIASLLLTPVIGGGRPLGLLEFRHRTHRRWTTHDMAQARILAEHVASVLLRMPSRARTKQPVAV